MLICIVDNLRIELRKYFTVLGDSDTHFVRRAPVAFQEELRQVKTTAHHYFHSSALLVVHCGVTVTKTTLLACRPLGQIETVSVVDLRATWLLTGNDLPPVTTAETLVLPLFSHFLLGFLLHGDPSLPFLQFRFLC